MLSRTLMEDIRTMLRKEFQNAIDDPDYDAVICSIVVPPTPVGPSHEDKGAAQLSAWRHSLGFRNAQRLSGKHLSGIQFRLRHGCNSAHYSDGDNAPILEVALQFQHTDTVRNRDGITRDIGNVLALIEAANPDDWAVDWYCDYGNRAEDDSTISNDPVWLRRY